MGGMVNMNYSFPIFILAKDDKSVRMSKSEKDIEYYEQPDIEEGLYVGWDVNGYPLRLVWRTKEGPKIEVSTEIPHIDQLKTILYEYVRYYRPDVPFQYAESAGSEDDIVALYKAIEEHINAGRLRNKIKKFFSKKNKGATY